MTFSDKTPYRRRVKGIGPDMFGTSGTPF